MLVFFTDLRLMESHFRYLALILHLSVIDGFKWFWMRSLHKNIQLMLEFLEVPGHTLLGQSVNDLLDDGICNIAIYAGFYRSHFVYSSFSPKIQFLYCLLSLVV